MMRFSGAVTMFGMEQVQNAMTAPADTRAALLKLRDSLDSMAASLVSKVDSPKRAMFESISKAQTEVIDRAFEAVNLDKPDEFIQKTSESLSSLVTQTMRSKAAGAA